MVRETQATMLARKLVVVRSRLHHERQKGAYDERRAVLAKLRRLAKKDSYFNIDDLIKWILARGERYDKAVGGLGKR